MFEALPQSMLLDLFNYLDKKDIVSILAVNKGLREQANLYWRNQFKQDFPAFSRTLFNPDVQWIVIYETVKKLEHNNREVNKTTIKDWTTLLKAVQPTHINHIENWLKNGGKTSMSLLHFAMKNGYSEATTLLIEKGGELHTDQDGNTPLHLAVKYKHFEAVKLLIRKGSDINQINKHGNTPLHLAIENNDKETVKFLLENGAALNQTNYVGDTPLHIAMENYDKQIIEILFKKDIDLHKKNLRGETFLHKAVDLGDSHLIDFFIKNGVEINEKSIENKTALHLAARKGHFEACKILLRNGAMTNVKDNYDNTPFSEANRSGESNIINLFKLDNYRKTLLKNIEEKKSDNKPYHYRGNFASFFSSLGVDLASHSIEEKEKASTVLWKVVTGELTGQAAKDELKKHQKAFTNGELCSIYNDLKPIIQQQVSIKLNEIPSEEPDSNNKSNYTI
ncbi:ankyrin repeat domain-containing protein [Legionella fairfieldensis]|uniref:ankyrin repeat domain-containing protein n=1 Tax=Legionella fairfieldensis TaxID=45064 RepID=UPI00048C59B4|nr:ankyrin repeat domain-containing protein [Legionella fairfieldensis]